MRLSRLTAGVVAATAAVLAVSTVPAAAAETVKVHPSDVGTDGWYIADTRAGGSATFTADYADFLGTGAVLLDTEDNADQKAQLLTDEWDGTRLADITTLGYATYQIKPSPGPALPALNIRADMNGDGAVDAYLVYEPYQNPGDAAVRSGEWQTWDALRGGDALWWSGQITGCGQSTPCTWASLLLANPDAQILEDPDSPLNSSKAPTPLLYGSIGFNLGSSNSGTVGLADALHIATAARDVTYDFETDVVLRGMDNCKNGGWTNSSLPVFPNQGQCVSHFAGKSKSRG